MSVPDTYAKLARAGLEAMPWEARADLLHAVARQRKLVPLREIAALALGAGSARPERVAVVAELLRVQPAHVGAIVLRRPAEDGRPLAQHVREVLERRPSACLLGVLAMDEPCEANVALARRFLARGELVDAAVALLYASQATLTEEERRAVVMSARGMSTVLSTLAMLT